ncbi:MAG TPA: uroporphyrinogen decarboxylase family protein [Oscillospiraceae bacterium]|nr:uroporphyrinogen decarboxylase family protein [Oscillospiraceae bacterium]HPS35072.1 uroporphyrinogen decarboxylase family protein [Oscillospiraceae bacterium]
MTPRERLQCIFNGKKPDDRLPVIEWAGWWDKTVQNWESQGLPKDLGRVGIYDYFNMDRNYQFWLQHSTPDLPKPISHGAPVIHNIQQYREARKNGWILPDAVEPIKERLKEAAKLQQQGEITWFTMDGFFWWPRVLLGIEPHLYSFYDEPEMYHEICEDLVNWQLRMLEKLTAIIEPDFMTFAEDMSYNNGPMLSEDIFDEFMKPYYQRIIPELKKHRIKAVVDSDGDISKMVPWLIGAGMEGILPLERQAGVDIVELSKKFPDFIWVGGFDKMCMFNGRQDPNFDAEKSMRAEFERLLPALRHGRYVASVDHQTPPSVKMSDYVTYVRLAKEYAEKAVK